MLCAGYQGPNPNALVSSGLAPVFKPRRCEPCPIICVVVELFKGIQNF